MTTVTSSYVPVWRFADNNNNPLVGGKVYTYYAGTTTPAATYTDATGSTPLTNPIILNARGETANASGASCSVWFSTTIAYKIVVQDSSGNLIWTVDNYTIPSQAYSAAYADTFTATAGQTVFTLTGTVGSQSALDVSLDGATLVNGVDFTWTSPSTLTLTVGAKVGQILLVKYLIAQAMGTMVAGGTSGQILYNNGGSVQGFTMSGDVTVVPTTGVATVNAPSSHITYTQGGTGATSRTVTSKLQESVSVLDFGADPTGSSDSTTAINNAIAASAAIYLPTGTYKISSTINLNGVSVRGDGPTKSIISATQIGVAVRIGLPVGTTGAFDTYNCTYEKFGIACNANTTFGFFLMRVIECTFKQVQVLAPTTVASGFAAWRLSGAVYLSTFENCVGNTSTNTTATNGTAWSIGNGLNEVNNANGLTNVNTLTNCRGLNFPIGMDLNYCSSTVLINPDIESNSTAGIYLRASYNTIIAPWFDGGSTMLVDQYTPTNGSGGTGAATNPIQNTVTGGTYPFSVTVNNSTILGFQNCYLANVTLTSGANRTFMYGCYINGTLTNSGYDCNLEYVNGGMNQKVVQSGNSTVYSATYNNGDTTITMNGSQYIESKRFGNLILSSPSGIQLGLSTDKLSAFAATPVVQQTTSVTSSTFTANAGTAVNNASTFDGYTIAQVVKAMRNYGLLA